jgi:hypothetical protein
MADKKTVISAVQGEDTFKVTPVDTKTEVVNNVQKEDFYELPSVAPVKTPDPEVAPMTQPVEVEPEAAKVEPEGNLKDHVTDHPANTVGGQLDIAIDLFILRSVDEFEKAKTELLTRLKLLEAEADDFVAGKIAKVRAFFN